MIYTVTFNPSLDYIVSVEDFQLGMTNRTDSELLLPGGKGINVSTVLMNLGIENTALGFTAGFTGDEIRRKVEEIGVKADFIQIEKGVSRINLKLKSIDGTEINGQGPDIGEEKVEELLQRLDGLSEGDVLVFAGSIPASMPDDIYRDIMKRLTGRGIMIVVDATRDLLVNVLEYHPFLIKPNNHELGEIFGTEIKTREEVPPYARKLQEMGACNVLVSMAGQGAVLAGIHGKGRGNPCGGGRQYLQTGRCQGNGQELSGGRGFHGGRISGRMDGKERLCPRISYGNRGGKCQRVLGIPGETRGNRSCLSNHIKEGNGYENNRFTGQEKYFPEWRHLTRWSL